LRISRPGVEWSSDLFEVALQTLLRGALRDAGGSDANGGVDAGDGDDRNERENGEETR
jgi:hypothetical protein